MCVFGSESIVYHEIELVPCLSGVMSDTRTVSPRSELPFILSWAIPSQQLLLAAGLALVTVSLTAF